MSGLRDHALRVELAGEVHARPSPRLQAPLRATHLALLSGEGGADAERRHVAALCERFGAAPPAEGSSHLMVDLGAFRLRWERHGEFATYTFFRDGAVALGEGVDPFAQPAIDLVPGDWLSGLPGERMVAVNAVLARADAAGPGDGAGRGNAEVPPATLDSKDFAGSRVTGGLASAWMDFWINADGFGRMLILDRGLTSYQAGRLVQRLLEIETYRMMALLALPLARRHGPQLSRADQQLSEITQRLTELGALEEQRRLLDELTELSASIEAASAATNYRFGAARAYYALVRRRVEELRETRVEGYQTIGEFMERRMAPAMRTCEAVAQRLETLSGRLARANQLLRARIEIQLEAQIRNLLASMNRRAKLQLRLQETVEGLSVAAISYYLASLVGYVAKGMKAGGLPVDSDLATALSIPLIAVLVWIGVRRVRRRVGRAAGVGKT